MAWYLYRLGRASFRNRGKVLVGWLLLLVMAFIGAATLSGDTKDSFSLPGLESTQAYDLIEDRTPEAAPDGATARITFQAPEGEKVTTPENMLAVQDSLAELKGKQVSAVQDPFATGTVSENGRTAYATVNFTVDSLGLTEDTKHTLESSVDPAEEAGLKTAIGGDALQEIPEQGAGELAGVAVAALVLLITFGTMVAAGLPLLSAIVGVGIGVAGITTLTGFMDLGSSTPILASMLGLAVGIDYALFIVTRFRHEVQSGRQLDDAAGRAVGTAGSAVVFAGLTVIIALVGLSIVNIRFLTEMGLAAAATVGLSVLIALTLLPALFGFAGQRIAGASWLPGLRGTDANDERPTAGRRWGNLVTKFRWPALIIGTLAAIVVSIPVGSMQLALPDDGTQPEGSGPRVAYDTISEDFGAGANGPLQVVVDTKNADDPKAAVAAVTEAIAGIKDDVSVVIPADGGPLPKGATAEQRQAKKAQVKAYEGVLEQGQYATIIVVPESGPADADTQDLVHDLRDAVDDAEEETGAKAYVTGQTALGVDVSDKLASVFPTYLALVVGLAFILLMLVFRSILVPLKAVVGFLFSVLVSLGATVAVFQWGWMSDLIGVDKTGPIMAMLPILLVGILFGLAMDYEVFLVSRMREEFVHGATALDAVRTGFAYSARVVTAAAIIMVSVFGAFAITGDTIIKTIGFGLAIGVLADAFLVRMTLVPALMAIMGKASWWLPGWLAKAMPNLDIEGESLVKHLAAEQGAVGDSNDSAEVKSAER